MGFETWELAIGLFAFAVLGLGVWLVHSGRLESLFAGSAEGRIERDITKKLAQIADAQTAQGDNQDGTRRKINKLSVKILDLQKERKLLEERLEADAARDKTRLEELKAELEALRVTETALRAGTLVQVPPGFRVKFEKGES